MNAIRSDTIQPAAQLHTAEHSEDQVRFSGPARPGVPYEDRPGAYGILLNDWDRLAVIEIGGRFFLPGGGLRADETPEEGLAREILEELGYEVLRRRPLGQAVDHTCGASDGRHYRIHGYYFLVEEYAPRAAPLDRDHVLRWLDPADALANMPRQAQAWMVRKTLWT